MHKKIHYPTQHAANAELYSTLTSASWFLNSLTVPYAQVERTLYSPYVQLHMVWWNSFWTEFTSQQQQHLPSNQCCPLSSILLWTLHSEPTAPLFKTFHNMFCLKFSRCVHQFCLNHYR